jgi:hypothetical protein
VASVPPAATDAATGATAKTRSAVTRIRLMVGHLS